MSTPEPEGTYPAVVAPFGGGVNKADGGTDGVNFPSLVPGGAVYGLDPAGSPFWVIPDSDDQILVSDLDGIPLYSYLVNANVDPAAGIVYSKLNLTNGIVNADINTAAAIAYSKLNLANSIVNADIKTTAAIAVSKLAAGTEGYILVTFGGVPTWRPITDADKRILLVNWQGDPLRGRGRTIVVPRSYEDTSTTFNLKRVRLRMEYAGTSGTTTVLVQKSAGGNAEPSWSTIATLTLAAGAYEATDVTSSLGTVATGDLLSVYFTDVSANSDDYTVELIGNE